MLNHVSFKIKKTRSINFTTKELKPKHMRIAQRFADAPKNVLVFDVTYLYKEYQNTVVSQENSISVPRASQRTR